MVRAKFTCQSVQKSKHWDGTDKYLYTAILTPVVSGSDENKSFFSSTPTGRIELGSFSENHFEPGKSYYIDFTPAE